MFATENLLPANVVSQLRANNIQRKSRNGRRCRSRRHNLFTALSISAQWCLSIEEGEAISKMMFCVSGRVIRTRGGGGWSGPSYCGVCLALCEGDIEVKWRDCLILPHCHRAPTYFTSKRMNLNDISEKIKTQMAAPFGDNGHTR